MTRSRDDRRKALKDKEAITNIRAVILSKHGIFVSDKEAVALLNGARENVRKRELFKNGETK